MQTDLHMVFESGFGCPLKPCIQDPFSVGYHLFSVTRGWVEGGLTDGRSDAPHGARSWDVPGHGCSLGRRRRLRRGGLLLHLPVALTQVKHLGDRETGDHSAGQTPGGQRDR